MSDRGTRYIVFLDGLRYQHPQNLNAMRLLFDLDDRLDFHGNIERKGVRADGRASVHALLAEDLADRVRCAVDHTWLTGEAVDTVDKADELDDALDLVEITQLVLERRDETEGDVVSGVVTLLWGQVLADLAHNEVSTRRLWQVASSEDIVASAHTRAVVALGLSHRWERVTELLETAFDVHMAHTGTGSEGFAQRQHDL